MNESFKIEGYACKFNQKDLGADIITPNAFQALKDIRPVKMLYQHEVERIIGEWQNFKLDHQGLWVEGIIHTDLRHAGNIQKLIQYGLLDGLSIGFKTLKSHMGKASKVRYLTQIELWEISIVTFPMQPEARIKIAKDQKTHEKSWAQQFQNIAKI